MPLHPLAGKPAESSMLCNIPRLISAYYTRQPSIDREDQKVRFGTSGHRGSSLHKSLNEPHILAITQAICNYRKRHHIDGPLFIGMDTHALSEPCYISSLEVLAANGVKTLIQKEQGYTPTPVISHAILSHNKNRSTGLSDGIVITPSHNPPEDGGFKYNPPHGGPADTEVTQWIENTANDILRDNGRQVKRIPFEKAIASEHVAEYDYTNTYIEDLKNVVDLDRIRSAGLKIGVDPMGGAAVDFWDRIAARYGLTIDVVNPTVDPTFQFMTVDKDGKIRMDCSSPYAMARLIDLKADYDIAFGNDPDVDRHGIVTPTGLMNPNHYLAVAIEYLFQNRNQWRRDAVVGKTLVSSAMINKVAGHLNRVVAEVPVGFKWFVNGLLDGSYGFGGEESAGAAFLRKDGTVWTTDKDGIILNLLAAEITAVTGEDPSIHYRKLEEKFGKPIYERIDAPASPSQKRAFKQFSPEHIQNTQLAGDEIIQILTKAPGNNAPIGGLKVVTEFGWFAARPSGTEDIYKIYTESFKDAAHLKRIQIEAQEIVDSAFKKTGA